jgi:hypothetical protein
MSSFDFSVMLWVFLQRKYTISINFFYVRTIRCNTYYLLSRFRTTVFQTI